MNTLKVLLLALFFGVLVALVGRFLFRRLVRGMMRRASPASRAGGPTPRQFAAATAITGAVVLSLGVVVGLAIFPALWQATPEMRADRFLTGVTEGDLEAAAEVVRPGAGAGDREAAVAELRESLADVEAFSRLEGTEAQGNRAVVSGSAHGGGEDIPMEIEMREEEGEYWIEEIRLGGDVVFGASVEVSAESN